MTGLSLEGVSRRYGKLDAVDHLSLDVPSGEILCLLGPSGCGKSTLLRIIAGLEPSDGGRVVLDDREVDDGAGGLLPPEARNVGFVFQDFALFPHLTVRDNIAFGLNDLPAAERTRRVDDALARVNMTVHAGDYPNTLSGGEQQRVALARAMAPAPSVYLLDEPFSGLDARLRRRLAEETWRLLKQSGVTTIIVTHDPEEAMLLGDRIAIMRAGRLEQVGTPTELYSAPASPFVVEFLSDANRLAATVNGDGSVHLPFGNLGAGGLPEGAAAEVLVRYEAVSYRSEQDGPETGGVPGRVRYVRPYGRGALVWLEIGEGDSRAVLRARVPRKAPPAEGSDVMVIVDPENSFVFAADSATKVDNQGR